MEKNYKMSDQCFLGSFLPRSLYKEDFVQRGLCPKSKLRHWMVKCFAVAMWEGNGKAEHRNQVPKLLSWAETFSPVPHAHYRTHCYLC